MQAKGSHGVVAVAAVRAGAAAVFACDRPARFRFIHPPIALLGAAIVVFAPSGTTDTHAAEAD